MRTKRKGLKITLITIVAVIILLTGGFLLYASDYYRAEELAQEIIKTDKTIQVEENQIILSPSTETDTALIFYPGAKVEYTAYLPILEKIKEQCNIMCILVKMPLNMAIFNANAADEIIEQYPNIKNWYMGGHSMGGAMASSYASDHEDQIKGLILMGAYVYGDYPPQKSLTIYGTFNSDLEKKIDYTDNIVVIEGGNHAQFGNYGKQKGDPDATITAEKQQEISVEAVKEFLETGKVTTDAKNSKTEN